MKHKKIHLKYIIPLLFVILLISGAFLLPIMTMHLMDKNSLPNSGIYDFTLDTTSAREIPLENRLKRLLHSMENEEQISYIPILNTNGYNPESLCNLASAELKDLQKRGIYRYFDYFDPDIDHLTECQYFNLIAGYSTKICVLSWANTAKENRFNTDWNLTVILDYDTKKILALSYYFGTDAYTDWYKENYAAIDSTITDPSPDVHTLAQKWLDYWEFTNVSPLFDADLPREDILNISPLHLPDISTEEADFRNVYSLKGWGTYLFYVKFGDEKKHLALCACYGTPASCYTGTGGFNIFFNIIQK